MATETQYEVCLDKKKQEFCPMQIAEMQNLMIWYLAV